MRYLSSLYRVFEYQMSGFQKSLTTFKFWSYFHFTKDMGAAILLMQNIATPHYLPLKDTLIILL